LIGLTWEVLVFTGSGRRKWLTGETKVLDIPYPFSRNVSSGLIMKTIRVRMPGGLANLSIASSNPTDPGFGEIKVRVRASSLNYHDYAVVMGTIKTPDGRIPLSDAAGDVIEVGPGVEQFAVGDQVISHFFPHWWDGEPSVRCRSGVPGDGADGFARELTTMPVNAFSKMPKGLSYAEAATLPCAGLTAWRALFTEGHLKPGDTVLVQGTGGVSIFALQFAKAAGARVIATSSSEEKLVRLKSLGADHLINYRKNEKWGVTAREMTDDQGVDHVVEVGGAESMNQSITACRNGGRIAVIGVLSGLSGKISTYSIMGKQLVISGLTVGSRKQQHDMIRAIEVNDIHPVIDSTFPLDHIAEAFERQQGGRHFGKICLEY
jgi:NADPH:quinone reductase-like Zn-dependent oxidoreductase